MDRPGPYPQERPTFLPHWHVDKPLDFGLRPPASDAGPPQAPQPADMRLTHVPPPHPWAPAPGSPGADRRQVDPRQLPEIRRLMMLPLLIGPGVALVLLVAAMVIVGRTVAHIGLLDVAFVGVVLLLPSCAVGLLSGWLVGRIRRRRAVAALERPLELEHPAAR